MRSSSRWSPTTFTWTGPYEASGLRVSPAAQLGAAADHSLRSWRLSARVVRRHRAMRIPLALFLIAMNAVAAADSGDSGATMVGVGRFFRDDVVNAMPGDWHALCATARGVVRRARPFEYRRFRFSVQQTPAHRLQGGESKPPTVQRLSPCYGVASSRTARLGHRCGGQHTGSVGSDGHRSSPQFHDRLYAERPLDGRMAVILVSGELRQQLAVVDPCCNDAGPTIVWAGDLDRDDKLDLLMNLSGHYAGSVLGLFLSSAAGKGELVGQVARFAWSSC